ASEREGGGFAQPPGSGSSSSSGSSGSCVCVCVRVCVCGVLCPARVGLKRAEEEEERGPFFFFCFFFFFFSFPPSFLDPSVFPSGVDFASASLLHSTIPLSLLLTVPVRGGGEITALLDKIKENSKWTRTGEAHDGLKSVWSD
ncbi:hypothetical protein AOLI_G00283080, partial [Acnodon oligacanthus]